MSYVPQPGTIPHHVINFLKSQPEGAEFPTAVICEELGVHPPSLNSILVAAVRNGVIRSRKDARGWLLWSLGDGVALAQWSDFNQDEPLEPDDAALKRRQQKADELQPLIKAVAPSLVLEQVPRKEVDMAIPVFLGPAKKARGVPKRASTSISHTAFRVGEFSDGTFVLERSQHERIQLTEPEFAVLLEFVERRAFGQRATA